MREIQHLFERMDEQQNAIMIAERDKGDHRIRSCRCTHPYRAMALAQLNRRCRLRDLVICLRAHREKLYHLGRPNGVSRTTLANAHENRDWRIDADDAYHLIDIAKPLYGHEDSELKLAETVDALDSSTIS